MLTFGNDICLDLANAEIDEHHKLMAPAKKHIMGSRPTKPQENFYGPKECNAFWFTETDLLIFLDAIRKKEIEYVVVVLGAHRDPKTAPKCPDQPPPSGNFDEGSQTVILAGSKGLPKRDKKGVLAVTTSAPYRQYPTQGYVHQMKGSKKEMKPAKKT